MKSILLIIHASLILSCGMSSSTFRMQQPSPVTHIYRFLALGDSYTIGESVGPEERWPVQLATSLRKERIDIDDPLIIAKTGWTTDELDAAITSWNPTGRFDLVTLLIGVNNQYRGRSGGEYRTQFAGLLQRAIEYAGNDASHVLVLSIPDWGVTPFAQGRDAQKIAADIDLFNTINTEETRKAGALYVDVTPASRKVTHNAALIAGDGLHPSGLMYAEWTQLALPVAMRIFKPKE